MTCWRAFKQSPKVKELWAKGVFNLTKFTSNNGEGLKSIPNEDKRKNVTGEELKWITRRQWSWSISKDTLGFQTKITENHSKRPGLLSMLHNIYDKLCLRAPFLLKGRLIIQQLCRDKLGWDESIDEKSSYE